MHRRQVSSNGTGQKAGPRNASDLAPRAEEAPGPRQAINIDELFASPWIGLHYRHEYLLHHRHELLVQQLED
ncbi:hypothetical protein D7003_11525 [Arthrobacter oryzae]|uniref:Uncharacterized protein n=1 Tax=Arthrobacter oryzae TaxID=409290 RepID=A0A3N0BYK3_9MICC|nr:hypothetical protein D7003_11525 [Arthrobacter oryzae]